MAHTSQRRDKPGQPLFGQSEGSRGAAYFHTTDGAGAISCTCPDFMTGKSAKGTPVPERVCKHLREILAGNYDAFTPHGKQGSALGLADEIKKKLGEVERDLLKAKTPDQISRQLGELATIRVRASAFVDKLSEEIRQVEERLTSVADTAKEKL